jgi:ABC-type antimicrobial peptide transport system permease subunit
MVAASSDGLTNEGFNVKVRLTTPPPPTVTLTIMDLVFGLMFGITQGNTTSVTPIRVKKPFIMLSALLILKE